MVAIPVTNVAPGTCTSLNSNAANCTITGTFTFSAASPALNTPGNYPNNTWTMQLYAPANNELEASQYFQIKGYSSQTQVDIAGVKGQSLTFGCCTSWYDLQPSRKFDFHQQCQREAYPIAADPIKGIEYTNRPGRDAERQLRAAE